MKIKYIGPNRVASYASKRLQYGEIIEVDDFNGEKMAKHPYYEKVDEKEKADEKKVLED